MLALGLFMVKEIRVDYRDGGRIVIQDDDGPLDLLKDWINGAIQKNLIEANAMCLSTVGSDGAPRSRMVLLKHINDTEIGFFTNLNSDKALEIDINKKVAITMFWAPLEKQVRILGTASEFARDVVSDYHFSRPRLSQIAAYTSTQSKELASIEVLDEEFRTTERKYKDKKIPLPNHWGGYKILVESIEYWSGRPSRLHERVILQSINNEWKKTRLYP